MPKFQTPAHITRPGLAKNPLERSLEAGSLCGHDNGGLSVINQNAGTLEGGFSNNTVARETTQHGRNAR